MAFFPKDHLSDHEYDGIREFDNPTPGWWHLIFLVTIVFSLVYFVYYHGNPSAASPESEWKRAQATENRKLFGARGDMKNDAATLLDLMKDTRLMSVGQGMFESNCAQCHAKNGSGINGVNLTDETYKNVKSITDFFNVISNGANNGAMPAWKNTYSDNERILLAAYVASMRGKNIPGRAAEGEAIPAWPTAPASTDAPVKK